MSKVTQNESTRPNGRATTDDRYEAVRAELARAVEALTTGAGIESALRTLEVVDELNDSAQAEARRIGTLLADLDACAETACEGLGAMAVAFATVDGLAEDEGGGSDADHRAAFNVGLKDVNEHLRCIRSRIAREGGDHVPKGDEDAPGDGAGSEIDVAAEE